MGLVDLQRIFEALRDVRYLVVGGVAVVLHGHPRFTADLDLVVALDPDNVKAAVSALTTLGYRPRAPVRAEEFADPETRRRWIDEKGLAGFSFWNPAMPQTEVDVFVEEPFPFDEAYRRGIRVELGHTDVTVVGIEDLVAMKKRAARPKDLEDMAALEAIAGMKDENG